MNHKTTEQLIKWLTLTISVALFVFSMTQYAYCTLADKKGDCTEALSLLLVGGLGIFMGEMASISWLANLTLSATWVLIFTAPKFALITSVATLLLILMFLTFDNVLINEAGGKSVIVSYGAGYWLWVLSSAFTVVGSILILVFNCRVVAVAQPAYRL